MTGRGRIIFKKNEDLPMDLYSLLKN